MEVRFIDTKTQKSLKNDIIKVLNLSEEKMQQIFESIYDSNWNPWEWIENYFTSVAIDRPIEYIKMYHLSRRINGTDLRDNNNLKELLLEKSPISSFLKKYNVTFERGSKHIEMYYNGVLEPLDDELKYEGGNIYYMRSRLGYNNVQDYCVNGFAFREYLEKNDYFNSLSRCPELIQNIEWLFDIKGMVSDYYENSKYYCIEYLIPLSEIIFDMDNPPDSEYNKIIELLKIAILRLYNDWKGTIFEYDENLIIRLSDDAKVKTEWFLSAEKLKI